MQPSTATALGSVWTAHRKWSAAADSAARHLRRWRLRNLFLLVIGAVLAAFAGQGFLPEGWGEILTGASAAVLAAAAVFQKAHLGKDRVTRHTTARSASETLKGAAYWYLAGVAPYDGADRDERLDRLLTDVDDLTKDHQTDYLGTEGDGGPPPAVEGIADYVTKRAEDQRDWHQKKSKVHDRDAARLRNAEFVATTLAAVTGAAALGLAAQLEAWNIELEAVIGLLTTVGATVAAHLGAAQYDKLASSYSRTATRLTRELDKRSRTAPTPETDAEFVRSVEEVLAEQNDGWVALLDA